MTLRAIWSHSLIRFLVVGGSLAMVYALLTAVLTAALPLPPPAIAVAVWLACIPPGYACQRRLTFADRAPRRHALLLYALTQAIGMLIVALFGTYLATREVGKDLALYLLASGLSAMISYLVNRLIIFDTAAAPPKR